MKGKMKSHGNYEVIIPSRAGTDLHNRDKTIDGHIRIERYMETGTNIYVDLFLSKIDRAEDAHLASESFPWNSDGAGEATRFLQENGFRVVVMTK